MLCPADIIAVTGSNGKTTVTTLIGKILTEAQKKVFVCGNIGNPFSGEVEKLKKGDFVVLEVSSFQLETINKFKPKIAVILNLTPNHLDRYKNIQEYLVAKKRIFMNQDKKDFLVLNADDPLLRAVAPESKSIVAFFNKQGTLNPNQNAVIAVGKILGIKLEKMLNDLKQSFPKQFLLMFSGKNDDIDPDQAANFLEENMRFACALPEATRAKIPLTSLIYILSLDPQQLQKLLQDFGEVCGINNQGELFHLFGSQKESYLRWLVENSSQVTQLTAILGILFPDPISRSYLGIEEFKVFLKLTEDDARKIEAVAKELDPNLATAYRNTSATLLAQTADPQTCRTRDCGTPPRRAGPSCEQR